MPLHVPRQLLDVRRLRRTTHITLFWMAIPHSTPRSQLMLLLKLPGANGEHGLFTIAAAVGGTRIDSFSLSQGYHSTMHILMAKPYQRVQTD